MVSKTITLDISIFSAKPNSTAVIAKQGITNLTLLKNGKLTAQIENTSGYRQTAQLDINVIWGK